MARYRMPAGDAAWLHMDRPTNRMIVNTVMWFDEPLDWDASAPVAGAARRPLPALLAAGRRAASTSCGGRTSSRRSTSMRTCTASHCRPRAGGGAAALVSWRCTTAPDRPAAVGDVPHRRLRRWRLRAHLADASLRRRRHRADAGDDVADRRSATRPGSRAIGDRATEVARGRRSRSGISPARATRTVAGDLVHPSRMIEQAAAGLPARARSPGCSPCLPDTTTALQGPVGVQQAAYCGAIRSRSPRSGRRARRRGHGERPGARRGQRRAARYLSPRGRRTRRTSVRSCPSTCDRRTSRCRPIWATSSAWCT